MDAIEHVPACLSGEHVVNEIGVTMQTRPLRHATVARLDLNRLVKVFERERQRMEKPVVGLGDPFADWVMRQVAIVADGDVTVARLFPGIKVPLHHMAVDAPLGIVAEVAGALAVSKGEEAQPREHPDADRQECEKSTLHSPAGRGRRLWGFGFCRFLDQAAVPVREWAVRAYVVQFFVVSYFVCVIYDANYCLVGE